MSFLIALGLTLVAAWLAYWVELALADRDHTKRRWEHHCKPPVPNQRRMGRVWACKCGTRFKYCEKYEHFTYKEIN